MQISANIIRFPFATAATAERRAEPKAPPAEIVAFPPAGQGAETNAASQEHGQIFAAHRIAARVADQLDAIAAL